MPYLGAPFARVSAPGRLLDAIDIVVDRHPQHLLRGHDLLEPEFRLRSLAPAENRSSAAGASVEGERCGEERNHLSGQPDFSGLVCWPVRCLSTVFYPARTYRRLALRAEYGYWQADLEGLEHLTRADQAVNSRSTTCVFEEQMARTLEMAGRRRQGRTRRVCCWIRRGAACCTPLRFRAKATGLSQAAGKEPNTDPFKFISIRERSRSDTADGCGQIEIAGGRLL